MESILDLLSLSEKEKTQKRTDYLSWTEYFMSVAFLSSQRSKDPSTQVGACIVNEKKHIVGIGYNGFPTGCSDDILPWSKTSPDGDVLKTKHLYVCHAEMNAILNKNSESLEGCSMYVTMFPCNECAKLIVQSGIRHVIYYGDKYLTKTAGKAARIIFDLAGVTYSKYEGSSTIHLDFRSLSPQDKC